MNFSSFDEFLDATANDDREFLSEDEIYKFSETACALANSSGGWIILGVVREFDDALNVTGLSNSNLNINSLIPREIFFETQVLDKILIVHIAPLNHRLKPLFVNGKFYRRVEGVNLISSRRSAAIVAQDAQNFSDEPAIKFYLNPESLEDFYNTVINLHAECKNFSTEEFLCRSFIFSGKFLTFAGALMFGNIIKVHAVLDSPTEHAELEARNLWDAYKNILPRLVKKLSPGCSQAFQEIFINALLHSDYHAGNQIDVLITNPPKVLITNPGTICSDTRNHRLKKIFSLSGIFREGRTLDAVRKFMPTFRLEEDILNFRVKALLRLEGFSDLNTPTIL
ncbi:MAG: putative DNA binding domain-containing protein [Synergistaceae bacterium]|nr:putative DNA binding domain-containing protein [Synergistaceae bacterium]